MVSATFDIILVCHRCGEQLEDGAVQKFNKLKLEWHTVLPACSGKCANAPNHGWVPTGITKKGAKSRPKRKRVNVDLSTFIPRPIEDGFDAWLADSKLAWSQIRFENRTKHQIKKQRTKR